MSRGAIIVGITWRPRIVAKKARLEIMVETMSPFSLYLATATRTVSRIAKPLKIVNRECNVIIYDQIVKIIAQVLIG